MSPATGFGDRKAVNSGREGGAETREKQQRVKERKRSRKERKEKING